MLVAFLLTAGMNKEQEFVWSIFNCNVLLSTDFCSPIQHCIMASTRLRAACWENLSFWGNRVSDHLLICSEFARKGDRFGGFLGERDVHFAWCGTAWHEFAFQSELGIWWRFCLEWTTFTGSGLMEARTSVVKRHIWLLAPYMLCYPVGGDWMTMSCIDALKANLLSMEYLFLLLPLFSIEEYPRSKPFYSAIITFKFKQ